ncbi:MAG: hypothetical protein COV97_06035 [Zetaproteobacteria bacterium CG11_big_fil_rev_8_21_14_0_20_59_439]|nr:MAG: hypothetical protein COV97_06035 [Zetaproteobacteria bacterium CG11_big_fil_rev_8_21_14_0_20_59_439]
MRQYRIILIGIGIGLLIWPVDSIVDTLFFEGDGFWEELLHPSSVKVYFRSTVMCFVLTLAGYAYHSTKKLRDSEERFTLAMRGTNDGVWDWNLETDTFYCSPRWKEMLGYREDEIGSHFEAWMALVHRDDRADLLEKLRGYTEGDNDTFESEIRLRHKDGDWVSVLSRGFLVRRPSDNKPVRMVGTHVDITERKSLEEANRRQMHHLQAMDRIGNAITRALTPDEMGRAALEEARGIFACDRAWLLYPCDPDGDTWEVPIESFSDTFPGAFTSEDRLPMSDAMRRLMRTALDSDAPVDLPVDPDTDETATRFHIRSRLCMAIRPRFGKPWLFGLHQCSHEREWSEQETALMQSIGSRLCDILTATYLYRDMLKLNEAIKQAGEAIMITDWQGSIEYVNPAFLTITGYSLDDVAGQPSSLLNSPDQDESINKQQRDRALHGETWHGSMLYRRKNGSDYTALLTVAPLRDEHNAITHLVSIHRDMSDYQKMEAQFLQAQKLEAVGTLVGGIAHDFNNMLAAIQGNLYLARTCLGDNPKAIDKLANIDQISMHSAEMVRQLLSFSRKDKGQSRRFSAPSFVKEAFKLARAGIPENISLRCDVCQENIIISGDATRLQQAIMNLLTNARDAVGSTKEPGIEVGLSTYEPTPSFLTIHPEARAARYALLSVHDNGHGIDREHLDKLFEPFFTTKQPGEGTGLGLAMVYGTVRAHDGIIDVQSSPGKGTTFRIYLPADNRDEEDHGGEHETPSIPGMGERILLVDDHEGLRKVTGEVLKEMGYRLLQAENGEQALKIISAAPEAIDLLITDVVMPKMGGMELAQAARAICPELPVIFISGYEDKQKPGKDKVLLNCIHIPKPYSFASLSHSIRNLLKEGDNAT